MSKADQARFTKIKELLAAGDTEGLLALTAESRKARAKRAASRASNSIGLE